MNQPPFRQQPYDQPYGGQQVPPGSQPSQPRIPHTEKRVTKAFKWFIGTTVAAVISVIVGAILTPVIMRNGQPTSNPIPTFSPTSTPSNTCPHLASSYSGTLTVAADGSIFTLIISALHEDNQCNFEANGRTGACPTAFQGTISQGGSLQFVGTQSQISGCGYQSTFSGQLFPDGHLEGTWQEQITGGGGTWKAL